MSPRGVYPRNGKKTTTTKTAAAKPTTSPKTKSKTNVSALPTPDNMFVRFNILTTNIQALASIRGNVEGSANLAKSIDQELLEHVTALTALRKQVFGTTEQETAKEAALPTPMRAVAGGNAATGVVPLPSTPPSIPVPPTA